jgi:hypothetical protein
MDTTKVITHRFENGREFTGTITELQAVAKALGLALVGISDVPRGYYNSTTDGLVKIVDMHSFHIRRALLKATTDYMKKVFTGKDTNSDFLKKYAGLTDQPVIVDFLNELVKRGDEMVTKEPELASASAAPKKSLSKKPSKK